jgi:REP element-mobilizing transposase RayT
VGRTPRTIGVEVTSHLVAYGNSNLRLFADDDDRTMFIEVLRRTATEHFWTCHAYCLLDTHVHLLVTASSTRLSHGMRDLLGRYARIFNRRYRRRGHLFRDRHRTFDVRTTRQLQMSAHGILWAPVEAGLVDRPLSWRWSSIRATLDLDDRGALDPRHLLRTFDTNPALARIRIERFLNEKAPHPPTPGVLWAAALNVFPPDAADIVRRHIVNLVTRFGDLEGVRRCLEYGHRRREVATALGLSERTIARRLRRSAYDLLDKPNFGESPQAPLNTTLELHRVKDTVPGTGGDSSGDLGITDGERRRVRAADAHRASAGPASG